MRARCRFQQSRGRPVAHDVHAAPARSRWVNASSASRGSPGSHRLQARQGMRVHGDVLSGSRNTRLPGRCGWTAALLAGSQRSLASTSVAMRISPDNGLQAAPLVQVCIVEDTADAAAGALQTACRSTAAVCAAACTSLTGGSRSSGRGQAEAEQKDWSDLVIASAVTRTRPVAGNTRPRAGPEVPRLAATCCHAGC